MPSATASRSGEERELEIATHADAAQQSLSTIGFGGDGMVDLVHAYGFQAMVKA